MTPSAAELVRNALGVKGGMQGAGAQAGAALLGAGAAAGGFARRRVSETGIARGIGDVMEERGRRGAQRFIARTPEWLRGGRPPAGTTPRGVDDIVRGRTR